MAVDHHDQRATDQQTLIKVYIGSSSRGEPRFDTLWVEGLPDGSYRLLRSPKNTLGIGKFDIFRVGADLAITEVLQRGGYWAVQVVAMTEVTPDLIDRLNEIAYRHGGSLDVHDHLMVGCAVPKTADFTKLKQDIDQLIAAGLVDAWWTGDIAEPVRRE
jgi:Domain of unknown function (DUF4265)